MTSGLSYHILYDGIHNQTQPLLDHLDILKPRVINVVGGAQKAEAFAFAKLLKERYSGLRVIWRNYPDDGNHDKERYKLKYHRTDNGQLIVDDASGCQRWVDDNAEYLQAGLTVLTDNESVRADLDVYAAWQAGVMDICTPKQWAVAVGRFATGNPQAYQYAQLDVMWRKLADSMNLHTFSPNEYARRTWEGNGGNIKRYEEAFKRCEALPVYYPQTSIGEWGVCYSPAPGQLDPEKGYRHSLVNMSGAEYARFVIDNWKAWYKPLNVDICVYCWGGTDAKWATFRVDSDRDFLTAIEQAAKMGELEPVTTSKPVDITKPEYTPAPVEIGKRYMLRSPTGNRRILHRAPMLASENVASIPDGSTIMVLGEQAVKNDWWRKVSFTDKGVTLQGWISMDGGLVKFQSLTTEFPAVTLPPAIGTPATDENAGNGGLQPIVILTRADIQKQIAFRELEIAQLRDLLARTAA